MTEYFFRADRLAFQHQTFYTLKELQFRLKELSDASKASIAAFHKSHADREAYDDRPLSTVVRYRFSSAIDLIQTFKDMLKAAVPAFSWEAFVKEIPQAELLQNIRNAVRHDGQHAVTLWADGQCYLAVNVSRVGQGKKIHDIVAPDEDVETLALRYFEDFANRLDAYFVGLPQSEKLSGPPLPYEWYEAATNHPALKRFQIKLPATRADLSADAITPLDACGDLLKVIASECRMRLSEIRALPIVPFP
jgi:hypothetical protein